MPGMSRFSALAPTTTIFAPAHRKSLVDFPLQGIQPPPMNRLDTLTKREREILLQVRLGLRDREIAIKLHISTRTVNAHLRSCYAKLGVLNRLRAVLAIEPELPRQHCRMVTAEDRA